MIGTRWDTFKFCSQMTQEAPKKTLNQVQLEPFSSYITERGDSSYITLGERSIFHYNGNFLKILFKEPPKAIFICFDTWCGVYIITSYSV